MTVQQIFKTLYERGKYLTKEETKEELKDAYFLKNKLALNVQDEEYKNLNEKCLLSKEPEIIKKIAELDGLTDSDVKKMILLAQRILKCKPVNNVFTTYLGDILDIKSVLAKGEALDYNIKKYPKFTGVRLKVTGKIKNLNIKYTLMFFKSGKVNCLGINDEEEGVLETALEDAKNKILSLLEKPSEINFNLVNCVLSVKIPLHINLKHLYLFNELKNWKNIKYNNQLFPGVITRPKDSKIRINFFSTGSAIFTGIRDRERRISAIKIFLELLNDYLKKLKTVE